MTRKEFLILFGSMLLAQTQTAKKKPQKPPSPPQPGPGTNTIN